jgi:hypothetical protein
MILNGRIGQVCGPFDNTDLLSEDGAIAIFTPETNRPILTKLGIQANQGTIVKINDVTIKIGKTGIYELENVVAVRSLIFPNGTGEDTLVDFVY